MTKIINVFREKLGNCDYILNDVVYLLRMENEEKIHYVHIKHLSRFMNLFYMNKDINMENQKMAEEYDSVRQSFDFGYAITALLVCAALIWLSGIRNQNC